MDERSQNLLHVWLFRDDDAFFTLDYFKFLFGKVLQQVNTTISYWLDTTTNESIRQKYLYVEKHIHQRLEENTNV